MMQSIILCTQILSTPTKSSSGLLQQQQNCVCGSGGVTPSAKRSRRSPLHYAPVIGSSVGGGVSPGGQQRLCQYTADSAATADPHTASHREQLTHSLQVNLLLCLTH